MKLYTLFYFYGIQIHRLQRFNCLSKIIWTGKNYFWNNTKFPKEEKYSLTDQIRRSSRSVCANFSEAYRKRIYYNHFLLKITDCLGENSETLVWLDFSLSCGYIDKDLYSQLFLLNNEVGKMLSYIFNNPEKFGVELP